MNFLTIITEPAILIITAIFIVFTMMVIKNYSRVETNLSAVFNFLKTLDKKELSYRFNELDAFMKNNTYTSTPWEDLKKALIFTEKLYVASKGTKNDFKSDIYLTIDASYFFNEDSLVSSKINHKFIQTRYNEIN